MFTVTPMYIISSLRNISTLFLLTIWSLGLNAHSTISNHKAGFFTNISSGGSIASDQTICFGEDPDELTNIAPASGGDNSLPIEYLWMQSVPGVSGWEAISGANGVSYDPPALNQTTAFMRCARRAGFANYTGEANVILITVQASPIVFITEAPTDGNDGDVLTFSASDHPFVTYTWDFGDGNTAVGQTVTHAYTYGNTYTVTLYATDNFTGCAFPQTVEVFILGPLPVELEYFEGVAFDNKKSVSLSWYTVKEENNNLFEIQKSVDGERFEVIGSILGQGNSNEGTAYSFVDDIPFLGINYYRLKQVDFSGEYAYSSIVAVHVDKKGVDDFTLYPNPAINDLKIRFKDVYEYEVLVTIKDVNNRVVKELMIPPHTLKTNIQIENLNSGVYSINLYSRAIRASKTFIKINL